MRYFYLFLYTLVCAFAEYNVSCSILSCIVIILSVFMWTRISHILQEQGNTQTVYSTFINAILKLHQF